jgi:hypothetical protein
MHGTNATKRSAELPCLWFDGMDIFHHQPEYLSGLKGIILAEQKLPGKFQCGGNINFISKFILFPVSSVALKNARYA